MFKKERSLSILRYNPETAPIMQFPVESIEDTQFFGWERYIDSKHKSLVSVLDENVDDVPEMTKDQSCLVLRGVILKEMLRNLVNFKLRYSGKKTIYYVDNLSNEDIIVESDKYYYLIL